MGVSKLCYHCGEKCTGQGIMGEGKNFCCEGCLAVYRILNDNGLCEYYALAENPGIHQKQRVRNGKFNFLDRKDIQKKLIQFSDGKCSRVSFYIPQMHCSSCIYLLESLPKLRNGVSSARVNFLSKEVFITFNEASATLREVVETMTAIGYEPQFKTDELDESAMKEVRRGFLYKLGIAGFCFSNIMMLSFPEYLNDGILAERDIRLTIRVITLLLSLPVVFYSASEFFSSAWKGLKSGLLNIDAPVALAILLSFLRSIYEIYYGLGSGYLDSMSGIVFFMLTGRFLQLRTQQALHFNLTYRSFFPIAVDCMRNGKIEPVPLEELEPNDVITIYNNEWIPVDAILSKGTGAIDYSFVNGESDIVEIKKGELIFAGGKQTAGKIELLVQKKTEQSYLTQLWEENGRVAGLKQERDSYTDRLSKWFTAIIFIISFGAAYYWYLQGQYPTMWNVLTTTLIVACPCALIIASSFTYSSIMRVFTINGFFLKSSSVILALSRIRHIVFDKTGTLTEKGGSRVKYFGNAPGPDEMMVFCAMLNQSRHPYAHIIRASLSSDKPLFLEHFKEIPGCGMECWYEDKYFKVGSSSWIGNEGKLYPEMQVHLSLDGRWIGAYTILPKYREALKDTWEALEKRYELSIVSGDNDRLQDTLQDAIGKMISAFFYQSPQDKKEYIATIRGQVKGGVMMIGDGLNDAGALMESDVGVAVAEENNGFTPASDIIMQASSFSQLPKIMKVAGLVKWLVTAIFIYALLYNIIGLYFSLQGRLTPVIAAILMPLSTLTIIFLSYICSGWIARWAGLKH